MPLFCLPVIFTFDFSFKFDTVVISAFRSFPCLFLCCFEYFRNKISFVLRFNDFPAFYFCRFFHAIMLSRGIFCFWCVGTKTICLTLPICLLEKNEKYVIPLSRYLVILVHTWLVEADTTISCHFLWAEMEGCTKRAGQSSQTADFW